MFAVIYSFKTKQGKEQQFVEASQKMRAACDEINTLYQLEIAEDLLHDFPFNSTVTR